MAQDVTVVYYPKDHSNPSAFHVMHIDHEKLQKAFDESDIAMIKCITVELKHLPVREARTLFTEADIKSFLDTWQINY